MKQNFTKSKISKLLVIAFLLITISYNTSAQTCSKLYLMNAQDNKVYDISALNGSKTEVATAVSTASSNLAVGPNHASLGSIVYTHSNTPNGSAVLQNNVATGNNLPASLGGLTANPATTGSTAGHVYGVSSNRRLIRAQPSASDLGLITGDSFWSGATVSNDAFFDNANNLYTVAISGSTRYLYRINTTTLVATQQVQLSGSLPNNFQGLAFLNGNIYAVEGFTSGLLIFRTYNARVYQINPNTGVSSVKTTIELNSYISLFGNTDDLDLASCEAFIPSAAPTCNELFGIVGGTQTVYRINTSTVATEQVADGNQTNQANMAYGPIPSNLNQNQFVTSRNNASGTIYTGVATTSSTTLSSTANTWGSPIGLGTDPSTGIVYGINNKALTKWIGTGNGIAEGNITGDANWTSGETLNDIAVDNGSNLYSIISNGASNVWLYRINPTSKVATPVVKLSGVYPTDMNDQNGNGMAYLGDFFYYSRNDGTNTVLWKFNALNGVSSLVGNIPGLSIGDLGSCATVTKIPSTFNFDCSNVAGGLIEGGILLANGTSQTAILRIPITNAVNGLANLTINGSGISTSPVPYEAFVAQNATYIDVPINFDGSGAVGNRTITITSPQGSGTCTITVPVELDTDSDGVSNSDDLDDDNDGILDTVENAQNNGDTDGDDIPNRLDLDSDNDGISDLVESGNLAAIAADTNSDGTISNAESPSGANGLPLAAETTEGGTVPTPKDTDGDSRPDAYDLDSDNDGINDLTESGNTGLTDTNSDGVVDGPDADGDGINDSADANDATFGDPETSDTPIDTDGDGIPNFRDLDSDGDGINDITESGSGLDPDGNGVVDGPDADGDGIKDDADANDGVFGDPDVTDTPNPAVITGTNIPGTDTDGDGITDQYDGKPNTFGDEKDTDGDATPNGLDLDDDNDGILDTVENAQGNGDTDGDGIPNREDLDSDNDGISDLAESGNTAAIAADANSDGTISNTESPAGANGVPLAAEGTEGGTVPAPKDTDGDSKPDAYDLDSDNDGINDLTESGNSGLIDLNSNGVVDGPDADGDGINDSADANDTTFGDPDTTDTPKDTDGDGIADFRDLDSDNDGINDLTESGNTGLNDTNSDGVVDGPDGDGDGIQDSADANDATFGDPETTDTPIDTDNDGIPNFRDLDSDGDGINDITESGSGLDPDGNGVVDGPDADGDGIKDAADANDGVFGDPDATDTPNPAIITGTNLPGTDTDGDGITDQFDGKPNDFGDEKDTDGDGIPNTVDLDDDNDGILDTVENAQNSDDTDADGIPNREDLDSDNDGISDLVESGNNGAIAADTNSDGTISNSESPAGANGVPLAAEGTEGGTVPAPKNTDGDGKPDAYDLDSDNDGINDLTESGNAGLIDENSDGVVDGPDADGDGINDSADANDTTFGDPDTTDTLKDTDGDGIADFRDLDSDNDGINDLTESGNTGLIDGNSDGVVDGPDADGDGINDSADANDTTFGDPETSDSPKDTDGDGIPDFRDLDSDNDGINDLTESGNSGIFDSNSDGVVDGPDSDGDGINNSVDVDDNVFGDPDTSDTPIDTDADGIPNYRDLDSEGDGINDIIESGSGLDSDGNGVVDGPDADGDGIKDSADANDTVFGDPDNTDTPNPAVITGTPISGPDTDGDGIADNFDDLPNQFGDEACLIEIGGGVYTDITPLDGVINGLPYIVPNLYMTLFKDNIQVAVTPFELGKYKFTNVEPGTYKLVIGTNILGSLLPSLPIGITYTSEGGTGGDGSVDGITSISVTCKSITYSSGLKVAATASYLNNNFGVGVLSGPLPVNLISFKAAQMNEMVNLTWKTSNETNFSHYELQHSTDAKEFGTIATLAADVHKFVDKNPAIGGNYYRLKMVDLDGTSQLSKTILVNFEKGAGFIAVENPARNGAFNVISNFNNPQFTLLNSMGQRIEIQVSKSNSTNYSVQTNNLAKGVYYLNIISEGKLTTKKVLLY